MLLPATLLFLASTALALPTSPLTARAAPSVYLCNDRDFTGYCKSISAPSGTCVPLASDFNDKLSSVGPDKGFLCYFFVYVFYHPLLLACLTNMALTMVVMRDAAPTRISSTWATPALQG
jgi:hypothetical protein